VRQNYGKLLRELGRGADSERELRIAVEQSGPDDSQSRISLAETLITVNKTGEAGALIAAALAREPKNPDALGAKGHLLLAEGRAAEALPYFEQATATSDVESYIELARAYLAAGQPRKARAAATDALRRVSGHPWAMAVLGRALILDGQRNAGVEYLQRALAVGPRRPAVWQSLADGFEAAGDAPAAAKCRREALRIPNSGF
jgi:predicted Zn-dependent protease